MPSFRTTVLAAAASLAAVAQADYVIDPESVPLSERQAWCASEKQTCPIICQQLADGTTKVNTCNPKTLEYGCICGDGLQPNVSEYSLTLPYFVCTEWGNQCVEDCGNNNNCASSCREDHPCGATDPKKYNSTSTATSGVGKPTASASDDGTTIFTDTPGSDKGDSKSSSGSDSSSSSNEKNAATAIEAGRKWGLAVVMGGMFVGFALL